MARNAGLLLPLAVLPGCKTEPTEVMVEIYSDYGVPAEIDKVAVHVEGVTGVQDVAFALSSQTVPPAGQVALPVRLALVPEGARDLRFDVKATALLGDTPVVSQEADLRFVPRQVRRLLLFLGRSCKGVTCDSLRTCSTGKCVPKEVDPHDLPRFDPSDPPPAADAFTPPPPDAAGEPDASPDLAPEAPACTPIFSDDFESGNLMKWEPYGAMMPAVSSVAPLDGMYSMVTTYGSLNAVAKTIGMPAKVRAQFKVDASGALTSGKVGPVFGFRGKGSLAIAWVYLFHESSAPPSGPVQTIIRATVHDTGTSMPASPTAGTVIPDPSIIRLEWKAQDDAGPGTFVVYANDTMVWTSPPLANATDRVEKILAGSFTTDGSGPVKLDSIKIDDCF